MRAYADVDFPVPDPSAFTPSLLSSFTDLASRLASREREFEEHFNSKWLALRAMSPSVGLADDIRRRLGSLTAAIPTMTDQGSKQADWLGLPHPHDASSVSNMVQLLDLLKSCPGIEADWLGTDALENLRHIADEWAQQQKARLQGVRLRICLRKSTNVWCLRKMYLGA